MRVQIVGSGGREHALTWKIAKSPRVSEVWVAPGSDAIGETGDRVTCCPGVAAADVDAQLALAGERGADLVVVGPEDPLAAGLADRLRAAGIPVFGPSAAAARLESSKVFAKEFMARHGIPTADFAVFEDAAAAARHVRSRGGPCVVKADGLAAGKGVFVCGGPEEAERALAEVMTERRFGAAGARVVVEERLSGEEASYYAVTDGERVVGLAAAQDHKRALDGDRGENTGGMGAYSPTPVFSAAVEKRVLEEIVHPCIRGMAAEGHPFAGVLFVGLMLGEDGAPRVVEFNARFGDPETQPLVLRMEGDLVPLLEGAASGGLERVEPPAFEGAAVCVVLASGGYPRDYRKGLPIAGLDEVADCSGVVVFHAGTRRGDDGRFETAGGRVLGVTARAESLPVAVERAYGEVDRLCFEGMHVRRDIAARAVAR